jgi:hypothetical protein
LAKAEESRADAALADAVKESANAGFAPPATSAAAPLTTQRQEAAEAAPERARTVAGFAPLILRTRSGNALWRIAGSVIERSADGGTTWTTEFRASGSISTGIVGADDTVWLVGATGLVLRRPATGPWRIVPPPAMEDLVGVSEPGAASVTVRTAAGRQFRTTDTGATWMAR